MTEYASVPVDPLDGPTFALSGRVVTMNDKKHVVDDGVVYVSKGAIVAVEKASQPAPEGFDDIKVLDTKGTIYPGLMDLHDHLSYNALQIWDVPKLYTNRDQWAKGDTYRKLVTGPMKVLAHTPKYVPAVVRYVESKCLVGGHDDVSGDCARQLCRHAALLQGGSSGTSSRPTSLDLPEAGTKIADVEAKDRSKFLKRLEELRLPAAAPERGHRRARAGAFPRAPGALGASGRSRARSPGSTASRSSTRTSTSLADAGASMVWSPLSNLLLYGGTADVSLAKSAGVTIALGPDWSPSGSKNLLGELKLARLVDRLDGSGLDGLRPPLAGHAEPGADPGLGEAARHDRGGQAGGRPRRRGGRRRGTRAPLRVRRARRRGSSSSTGFRATAPAGRCAL